MFERFTERARRTIVIAQEEARRLDHNYIGTEHILLGLIREDQGLASHALRAMGLDLDQLREEIEARTGRGSSTPSGHIPFTPQAKKSLELSLRESVQLGAGYIGTEHLLLGMIKEGEGPAAQVLAAHGVALDAARGTVARLLRERGAEGHADVQLKPGLIGTTLDEIATQLQAVLRRLSAIEAKLGIEPPASLVRLRELKAAVARVRRAKELAIDAQDFERSARLRDEEKQLLAQQKQAEQDWLDESEPGGEPPSPGAESA
ncbi:MAG TPA: Clp protease N-terminal domain-containing protein [Streptosporangiaceae bacterium]|nr:Clp protease N-terminal domain-containing protein [Streptosporangiaceae bacterium]